MWYLMLFLLITPESSEAIIPTVIVTGVTAAYTAYQVLNDAHNTYVKISSSAAAEPATSLDTVLNSVDSLTSTVDQMEKKILTKLDDIYNNLMTELPNIIELRATMDKLADEVIRVDNWYEKFEDIVGNRRNFNNNTLTDYAKILTSDGPFHLLDTMKKINKIVMPQRTAGLKSSLLDLIGTKLKTFNDENACDTGVPPSGSLYELYNLLMVTELRAFIILSFSYVLRGYFENADYMYEVEYEQGKMMERTRGYIEEFEKRGNLAPTFLRRCEPAGGYIRDETYSEFERFQTLYLVNQKDMFDPPHCDSDCVWIQRLSTRQHSCENSNCTEETRCRGHISNCVDRFHEVQVCLPDDPEDTERYLKINNLEGNIHNDANCNNELTITHSADSDSNDCSVCFCTCTEDDFTSYSRRIVSFRSQLSDIENNKVVTGIKFANTENITHIQIQQGRITYQGAVMEDTVEWKPLEQMSIDWAETIKAQREIYYVDRGGQRKYLIKRIDFGVLTADENMFSLDDIVVPKDYVITDIVRFNYPLKFAIFLPIQLEVRATPYDFLKGELIISDEYPSIWLTPKDMKGVLSEYDEKRRRAQAANFNDPREPTQPIVPIYGANHYLRLTTVAPEINLGQIVIPLLDAQPVATNPPFSLGAIGIFYKAMHAVYAGFFALHIRPIHALQYLQFSDDDN